MGLAFFFFFFYFSEKVDAELIQVSSASILQHSYFESELSL